MLKRLLARAGVILMVVALLPLATTVAQNADTREIAAYRLTDSTLTRYLRASRALAAIPKPRSADDETDEDDPSIALIAAKYDSLPAARRAITGAGLTSREYVVFTFALFQAGMAAWLVEQQGWSKLPPDVARANVEFYQRHKAQIDSMTAEIKNRDEDPT